jgi:hypothetical protein
MKIVLLRTPSFLRPVIKKIFESSGKSQKNKKKRPQK